MDRRTLIQSLLALPVVSALDGCTHSAPAPKSRSAKLRVVLGGAFGLVLQPDRNWGIRAFSPTDLKRRHDLHILGPKEDRQYPQEKQAHNFTLSSNGLEIAGRRPEIDPELCDFNVSTDKWCQQNYWVTIDLPAPRRIGFMGPMAPVHFVDPKRDGCMPPNHVLEYDVTDPDDVRMVEQGKDVLRPVPCEQLKDRYEQGCQKLEGAAQGMCKGKDAYDSFCQHGDLTLFFGIGLGELQANDDHPVRFFNERILESFPNLSRLRIDSLGHAGAPCKHACSNGSSLGQTVIPDMMPEGRFVEVSSYLDCQVTGPIVEFNSMSSAN